MTWDYEAYAAVKLGLAQPPSWDEWQSLDYRRTRRWLLFEEAARKKAEAERAAASNGMRTPHF